MVASTWAGVYLRSFGNSPRALLAPMACPILRPPPATRADMTAGQWSRPASLPLVCGVRQLGLGRLEIAAVRVPAADGQRYAADTGFDQPSRGQELLHVLVAVADA